MLGDRGERLLEAALDRLGELVAQPLELLQALLEVAALHPQVVEPLLLRLVLLLAQRVHHGRAWCGEPRAARRDGELVAVLPLGRLDGAGRLEPPRCVLVSASIRAISTSAVVASALASSSSRRSSTSAAPSLRSSSPELARPRGARVDTRTQRRLEAAVAARAPRRAVSRLVAQATRRSRSRRRSSVARIRAHAPNAASAAPRACRLLGASAAAATSPGARRLGGERAGVPELEQNGLGRLAREPQLAARRVVAEALGVTDGARGVEQRLERDDGELGDELRGTVRRAR